MKGIITIFPYKPFAITEGITLFNFQNKIEYSQLVFRLNKLKKHDTLIDDEDRIIHFYNDQKDPLNEDLKAIGFIGDLTSFDINSTGNLKYVFKQIISDSTILKNDIEDVNTQLNRIVFDAITSYESELSMDPFSDFEKILKAKDVRIDISKWENYCDKIIGVVSFYNEFTNKKLLLFHNLERLLSLEQLNQLNDFLKSIDLMVISLESYSMTLKEAELNATVYSIDEDHVRFDY